MNKIETREQYEALTARMEELRIKYLSKKGVISSLMNDFRDVAAEHKREVGKHLNELKIVAGVGDFSFQNNPCAH